MTYDLSPICAMDLAAGETVTLVDAPAVAGHTFSGWMLEGTNNYWEKNTPMPSENITLVATYNKDLSSTTISASTTSSTNNAPKTGDSSNLVLWGTLVSVAVLGMVGILVFTKKAKKDTTDQ